MNTENDDLLKKPIKFYSTFNKIIIIVCFQYMKYLNEINWQVFTSCLVDNGYLFFIIFDKILKN